MENQRTTITLVCPVMSKEGKEATCIGTRCAWYVKKPMSSVQGCGIVIKS